MSKLPADGTHPPLGTLIHDNTIQLVDILGSGGYGVVLRGVDLSSRRHRKYAIKCMSKAEGRRNTHVRELNYHMRVTGHPSIVEMYGAVEDDKFTYFIMEYATSSDLFHQIIHENRYLAQDDTIRDVLIQLIEGVQHCHDEGVYHRDLKPENVMCFEGGSRVAITDFGLATSDTSSCEFRTGSVYHMSPECQSGRYTKDAYSPRANDVWSLGIILLNMVTGRNPWKAATESDSVFQSYLQNPTNFFSFVLPISRPLNGLLLRVLDPNWKTRMSLAHFKDAIENISTFYSVNVYFEGNLARYCWEAGIEARSDLADGLYGPVRKRPVPPPPPNLKSPVTKKPVAKKPVSPIHEETKARPVEVTAPAPASRPTVRTPPPAARKVLRRPAPTDRYHAQDPSPQEDTMVSIALNDGQYHNSGDAISLEASHTPSSEGNSTSSSFPKTPVSSPHRVTVIKRRPRVPSDVQSSPNYSPQLDDPMELYGLEFCKRLADLPSDADSDDTDDTMLSPTSSQYSLHEVRRCSSWGGESSFERSSHSSGGLEASNIIRYPAIRTPEPSKPIDIVGTRRQPVSPRHAPVSPALRQPPPPSPRHIPASRQPPSPSQNIPPPPQRQYRRVHPAVAQITAVFRQRHPNPNLVRVGRVEEMRSVWEVPGTVHPRSYDRQVAYAPGSGHWYH